MNVVLKEENQMIDYYHGKVTCVKFIHSKVPNTMHTKFTGKMYKYVVIIEYQHFFFDIVQIIKCQHFVLVQNKLKLDKKNVIVYNHSCNNYKVRN